MADEVYQRNTVRFGRVFNGPGPNIPPANIVDYDDRAPPRMLSLVVSKEFGER